MNTQPARFFVYGSLRLGFRDPGYNYISRYFHFLGEGKANGKFYFNGSTPVAIAGTEVEYISGDLYELNDPEDLKWVLVQLDDYEGLNVEPGHHPLYKRDIISVTLNSGQSDAWVYWYNGPVDGLAELDEAEVAKYMQQQKKS